MHYPVDYQFGITEELKILNTLKEYFKSNIEQYPKKSRHDYFDNDNNYEVKSRKNTLSQYPDTMITTDKIIGLKPLYLIFNYTDCIAYIKYTPEGFRNYRTQMFSRARLQSDEKLHIFIPIKDLTIICKKGIIDCQVIGQPYRF